MKKAEKYGRLFRELAVEWRWLAGYIVRYKLTLAAYIVIGFLGTAMSLGVSVATKYLVDAVVGHSASRLPAAAAAVAGLAVAQIAFTAVASRLTSVLGTRAQNEIRLEIYSHILSSRWECISPYHSGDLLNRLEGDVGSVSGGVISFIPNAFTKLVQFFGALAIVLYYDRVMALLALMSAPFLFFSSHFLLKKIRQFNKQTRELNGAVLAFSEESVQNIQTVKAFDLTQRYISRFKGLLRTYRDVKLSYDKFSIILTACMSLIGLLVSYSCYGWGIYRLWNGVISYGTMTLFLQLSSALTSSFGTLASLAPSAVSIATSAGRIMEVTSFEAEDDVDRELAVRLLRENAESGTGVEVDNVSFRYADGDSDVLTDVSFTVRGGERIALVGPSGEGKTTLLRLLLGLTRPDKGSIRLTFADGSGLRVSDSTRRFFSYVPQSLGVFSGTIADNLLMVKPDADTAELRSVLERAALLDFVDTLPDGLDTAVGERGANLSQGQQQRLAIARALLKDAPLLLLDEATSALDPETEKRVLEGITRDSGIKTLIITTHRQSLLGYCDRVYRIDSNGRLVSENTKGSGE